MSNLAWLILFRFDDKVSFANNLALVVLVYLCGPSKMQWSLIKTEIQYVAISNSKAFLFLYHPVVTGLVSLAGTNPVINPVLALDFWKKSGTKYLT